MILLPFPSVSAVVWRPTRYRLTGVDGMNGLKTVLDTEYHNYQHTYKTAGIIGVKLKTTDTAGTTPFLQTIVQVNGSTTPGTTTSMFNNITNGLSSAWTEAPVPLYVAAVTLVLELWVGDIFQRLFSKDVKGRKYPSTYNLQPTPSRIDLRDYKWGTLYTIGIRPVSRQIKSIWVSRRKATSIIHFPCSKTCFNQ